MSDYALEQRGLQEREMAMWARRRCGDTAMWRCFQGGTFFLGPIPGVKTRSKPQAESLSPFLLRHSGYGGQVGTKTLRARSPPSPHRRVAVSPIRPLAHSPTRPTALPPYQRRVNLLVETNAGD